MVELSEVAQGVRGCMSFRAQGRSISMRVAARSWVWGGGKERDLKELGSRSSSNEEVCGDASSYDVPEAKGLQGIRLFRGSSTRRFLEAVARRGSSR